ncbi:DUF3800 domain-containing protein [Patescibacteria group bacterium]|nr:DUF3800 domain-containing protein [Patescibacteria group bacterium]
MESKKPDYYFYIDDSGSRNPDKQDFTDRDDHLDHFALGGVLIATNDRELIMKKYNKFCEKWNITYPLHSSEIRSARKNFTWLKESKENKEKFTKEIGEFLVSLPVMGFASVIYRPGYNERYKEKYGDNRWRMCKTAYNVLIERVSKYLKKENKTMYVRFEEAGKVENKAIIKYTRDLKNDGHPFSFQTSKKYNPLTNEDYKKIILGRPKRKMKVNSLVQIADLYLYPMAKRKYDSGFIPWTMLYENKRVIDACLSEVDLNIEGIKYSCFDNLESKKPKQA